MLLQVKRELRLLRLRGAMDPKRFYKSFDQSKFPKYFQFGTVVEGPADFYAGALLGQPLLASLHARSAQAAGILTPPCMDLKITFLECSRE